MIRTIIIDDEPDSVQLLQLQLTQCCPQVKIVASFNSSVKALEEIELLSFDLIFLDIEMPVYNGFEILKKLKDRNFNVIFVTAYNQFAVNAIRINALDYLIKPFEKEDLIKAVAKAEKLIKPTAQQLSALQNQLKGEPVQKIAVPDQNGITFIDFNEILYVEASDNYSIFLLSDKRRLTLCKTLKDVQEVLEERHFQRVHRQYIVNLNCVKHLNRNEGTIIINNGDVLPIARSQRERLIERYGWF